MTDTLLPSLQKHPFLADLPEDCLSLLAGCAKNRPFKAGEYLVRAGADADSLFLTRSGHVALLAPGPAEPLIVHTACAGELVGWSWMVAPYRYRFDAKALEDTLTFELDGTCLRTKCDDNPKLGYHLFMKVGACLGHRVDDLQLRLLDLYRSAGR